MSHHNNRFTVVGPAPTLKRFDARWTNAAIPDLRYLEIMECSPGRIVLQFTTPAPALAAVTKLSRAWSSLVFLLDYEEEDKRTKGLAKAKAGRIEHYQIGY